MVQSFLKVPIDALPDDLGVQVLRDGTTGAVVEDEQRVQDDLEGVHAELELTSDGVDKLQLHVPPILVGQGDETPAVSVRTDLHQLLDIGLLQSDRADFELIDPFWQEVQEGTQHHIFDQLKLGLGWKSHMEDEVQIFATQAIVFD